MGAAMVWGVTSRSWRPRRGRSCLARAERVRVDDRNADSFASGSVASFARGACRFVSLPHTPGQRVDRVSGGSRRSSAEPPDRPPPGQRAPGDRRTISTLRPRSGNGWIGSNRPPMSSGLSAPMPVSRRPMSGGSCLMYHSLRRPAGAKTGCAPAHRKPRGSARPLSRARAPARRRLLEQLAVAELDDPVGDVEHHRIVWSRRSRPPPRSGRRRATAA